jgi:methionine-rich copper-binding protein CopC
MRHISLALLLFLIVGPTGAHAHAYLDHATPAVGSTVASAPGQLTLWFTENIERKFSSAEVRNASGARVDQGNISVSGNVLSVGLKDLSPGTYRVHWRVLSVDTHRTSGSFSFRVGGQ